jgi:eukaryotic-like serine/threonine-protein kinase
LTERDGKAEALCRGDALGLGIEDSHDERADAEKRAQHALSLGKYRLFARLGTGGMAEVFLAVAQGAMNVNRLVVIKRLRDEQASDPGARQMFLNEARLAARLNHPNVIQTFEAGCQSGSYFLAMEYVDGQPLSRVLTKLHREGKTLEPRLAARICADALSGLHYAHDLDDFDGTALEIVHRDVSPQNIMLTYQGSIKLVDFGIAKAVGTAQTAHGVFKGKVAFMAPEQLLGESVDRRADLFTTGIVLWETVTGKPLMAEDSPAKTLWNLMNKKIPRASEVNPSVPAPLDDILARSLERDPALRYQSAREMRDALEGFIAWSGGVTHEEIADLMTGLFADTRDKIQAQIKGQLTALSFRHSDSALRAAENLSHTQIRATSPILIDLGEAFGADTSLSNNAGLYRMSVSTGSGTMAAALGTPASRTRRVAVAAWVAVTLIALAASGVALLRSQKPLTSDPSTVAVSTPGATATPANPAAPFADPALASPTTTLAAGTAATPTTGPAEAAAPSRPAPPAAAKPAWAPPPAPPPAPHVPPARPTASGVSTTSAPVETPKVTPPASTPAQKPQQEPPQGRTFRRDL